MVAVIENVTYGDLIGGAVAVLVAAMPALVALVKIRELHVLINSRLTQLIETTAQASHSAGQLEGRDESRSRAAMESNEILAHATDLARDMLSDAAKKARETLGLAESKARNLIDEKVANAGIGEFPDRDHH